MLSRTEYDNRKFLEKGPLFSLLKVKSYFIDKSIFRGFMIETCVLETE